MADVRVRSLPRAWSRLQSAFVAVAGMLIAFGVFIRVDHVDRRVFWDDEVIATIHILGTTEGELVRRAGTFRTVADLRAAVRPADALRPLAATIEALRVEDPQHPPLYYVLARLWAGSFGDSRAALRLLSVVIGLAALPCMFWLCMEIFADRFAAWAGVVLLAVSPVAVLYAQEVREYCLWLVATLVSSALFVRALRRDGPVDWLVYTLALGASLYVFPIAVFVAAAHACTAVIRSTSRRSRVIALAAIGLGFLLFAPWFAVMVTHIDQIERGMATINLAQSSPATVLRTLAGVVQIDILDLNGSQKIFVALLTVPILGFLAYAIWSLRSTRSTTAATLIWSLLALTSLPIVLPDLLLGGNRTANARYFIPFFIALDLALAALTARTLGALDLRTRASRVGFAVFALLLVARVGSCALVSQSQMWWSDYNNRSIDVAAAINAAKRPLLVGDDYLVWALSLSEYVDTRTRVALNPRCYLCALRPVDQPDLAPAFQAHEVASVFLIVPSKALQASVRRHLSAQTDAPAATCIDVRGTCPDGISL